MKGAGMTPFGKRSEGLLELLCMASSRAMEEAHVSPKTIDSIVVGTMNPEELSGDGHVAAAFPDAMGLGGIPSVRVETGMSTGAAAFQTAFYQVASGLRKTVLVACGEKMTHLPTAKTAAILSKVIPPQERQYSATMPALAALITRKYMSDFGLDRDTLSLVAVKSHHNASLNPNAQFQKEITVDEVNKSRMIADPLVIYDCAPITDGACAAILTAEPTPVSVAGIGQATDTWAVQHRETFTSFLATKRAARDAYAMAGIGPGDIGVAELHDAFTCFEIIDSEDVGFFAPGAGWKALKTGRTQINGDLPINTGGGLKARGHPIGASGLSQIAEIFWQLDGKAGARQVQKAKNGLALSIGGLASNNLVTILRKEAR